MSRDLSVETLPLTHDRFREGSRACTVTVDGRALTARDGELLVEALDRHGIAVPHVCFHRQLGPLQTCDTCLVEMDGQLARACAVACREGLTVAASSAHAVSARREAFDRILGHHQLYCTVCDNNNGDCTVHAATAMLGVEHQRTPYRRKPVAKDESNPFYRYDPDQCILCGRCVAACQNVQVNETLSIAWEDEHPRVVWDGGKAISDSSCVSCGQCVSACPCNALMETSMLGQAGTLTWIAPKTRDAMVDVVKGIEPDLGFGPILRLSDLEARMRSARIRKTKTVCTYCAVGCSYDVWTTETKVLKVDPSRGPANGISTCVKGKFGWDYTRSPDRLETPLVRTEDGSGFRRATWDEALDRVAQRFTEIKTLYGPDALGFVASSKTTNEEAYLTQKLARAVIGTNNIDNCSRYCQSPATQGLWRTVGYGGDSGTIDDLERASLVIIVGANPAENHPVLCARIKQAQKLRGAKIIVSDLRRNEMAQRANVFLRPRPGTDLVWLSAVTKYIIDQGWHAEAFLDRWVNGFEAYRQSLAPFTLEEAARTTGVDAETLRLVARMIHESPATCICWAMGITQHSAGSDGSTAISNLLLVTGNYMRPGTGAYPLRGHNNVQGASDFGAMPGYLPGYEPVADAAARSLFEKGWGVTLSARKGLDNHEMVDAALSGRLRSLYIVGEDMTTADANQSVVQDAFSRLELLVVEDIFFTDACRFADVVLPASPALEKDGTFTSTERRIQRLYAAFEPRCESRPDWRILRDLANRLGAGWRYEHPSAIMAEAAAIVPLFSGVTYKRLEGYRSLCWPVRPDGTDTPLLYTDGFHFPDGKARLYPLAWTEPAEQPSDEYPYHLNNGRLLEHFHEGHMTYRTPIGSVTPDSFVEIAPELAARLGVVNGLWVELTSRRGRVRVRALVSDRVRGEELFLTLNSTREPVNRLTSSTVDKDSHTPAYKEVAVALRVLDGPSPGGEPRRGFRDRGQRTPQRGVEVERKWKRADYRMPGAENPLVQLRRKEQG